LGSFGAKNGWVWFWVVFGLDFEESNASVPEIGQMTFARGCWDFCFWGIDDPDHMGHILERFWGPEEK